MERMDTFKDLEICKTWGLSLTEFLRLPRDTVEYIIVKTEKDTIERSKAASAAFSDEDILDGH